MFHDRADAGRKLAAEVAGLVGDDMVVLGLPRGGVPVAIEVAEALGAALDVIVVRKLGVPAQPELAMGAVGEGTALVLNESVITSTGVTPADLEEVEATERRELQRRVAGLRRGHERVELTGRAAVIVDDGIATGATARVACMVARAQGADRVILAAPVAARDAADQLQDVADSVVCVATPRRFFGVGQFYENFDQTTDEEVVALLARSRQQRRSSS